MRWMFAGALTLAAMGGCNEDKGKVTPTGDTAATDTDVRCPNVLRESYPEDGTAGVYPWSTVELRFSRPDTDAVLTVADANGAEVLGELSRTEEDRLLVFTPSGPMAPGSYTWTLEWTDCETRTASFDVSDEGTTPVADPADLVGEAYVLDLREARFVSPDNIGDALSAELEVKLLLGVVESDAEGITFLAGAEDLVNGGQATNAPTTRFDEAADFSANPRFEASSDSLGLVVEGDPITVTDLTMAGSFSADGSEIIGLQMRTTLDMRDLKAALKSDDDDYPCDLFSSAYGVSCTACPNGDGDYCIDLVVADLDLPAAGYSMVEVP